MAASRERSALHELRSELTCPVCLELFRAPVILECGHHFCSACIARCWEARTEESAPCPQCRAPCASRPRPNSLLCNVVDSVRRAGDARPQPGSLGPESDYCEEHEEKLKLFCEEDQRPICVVCGVSRLHRAHCLLPLNEAADSYKEKLAAALLGVQLQMEQATLSMSRTNQSIMEIKEQTDALEDQVTCEFRHLREFLDREEEDVRGHLREEKDRRLMQLDASLKHSMEQITLLERSATQLQLRLKTKENSALLRGIRDFILRTEMLFQPPPVVSTDLQLGQFVGPLQYRVWRKMRSIMNPAPVALTLDPDTAYPRLTVSPCRTSVWVGEIQPNLPDNPERFTRYNIVLGSQGFLSGRHYWEVEVGEKTAWGLGVAAESVNRKKETSLCPEDGFWTLVLRNGNEYEACTSTENLLHLPRKPWRIGVYLDYPRGLVSFYDVSDMSHLFTFSDTFSEKLYPYFNPWPIIGGKNREPLSIITLPV